MKRGVLGTTPRKQVRSSIRLLQSNTSSRTGSPLLRSWKQIQTCKLFSNWWESLQLHPECQGIYKDDNHWCKCGRIGELCKCIRQVEVMRAPKPVKQVGRDCVSTCKFCCKCSLLTTSCLCKRQVQIPFLSIYQRNRSCERSLATAL